jgi:hypothetical protein
MSLFSYTTIGLPSALKLDIVRDLYGLYDKFDLFEFLSK